MTVTAPQKGRKNAGKDNKSEGRAGGFADASGTSAVQSFGFMDPSFDRKRSKKEKRKAGKKDKKNKFQKAP